MARPKKVRNELGSLAECTAAMGELLSVTIQLEAVTADRDAAVAKASAMYEGAIDVGRGEYLRLLASASMEPVQIFHNPSCSKSRGALSILEERGVDAQVVRYLDAPPDRATLERILDAIDDDPVALVRTGDDKFKAAGLTRSDVQTRAQVIDVLLKHPEVMERPVVFVGDRAVIARPSERVLELLD